MNPNHKLSTTNCAGFSLIEVLVTLVLISIGSLATMSLVELITKTNSSQKFGSEYNNLLEEVRVFLGHPVACQKTLAAGLPSNTTFPPASTKREVSIPIDAVLDMNGVPTFDRHHTYGNQTVEISSIDIIDYIDTDPTYLNATMRFSFHSAKEVIGSRTPRPQDITLQIRRDATNHAESCVALAKMSDGIWTRILGTSYDIQYNGGRIGVGTSQPQSQVHFQGDVQIGNNDSAGVNADGLGPKLIVGGNRSSNTDQFYFQRNNFAADRSELRLIVGDNATDPAVKDRFTVGGLDSTVPGGFRSGVTITSAGEVGIGTKDPVAALHVIGRIRGSFDCRIVTNRGGPPTYVSTARCAADEFMLNGGGACPYLGPGQYSFLHASFPQGNAWVADCFKRDGNLDIPSEAYATCCKNGL